MKAIHFLIQLSSIQEISMVGYTVDVSIKTLKRIIPSAKEGGDQETNLYVHTS